MKLLKRSNFKEMLKDERGQGMTEYIIILLLVAIALIATWKLFGKTLMGKLQHATEEIENMDK